MQVTDGSATVKTTANAVVLSAQTAESGFTSTVLEARTTVAPSGAFYLIKVGGRVWRRGVLDAVGVSRVCAPGRCVRVVVAQAVNAGADKFSVSGSGELAVSGAATISGVLTASGGVTVTSGGL